MKIGIDVGGTFTHAVAVNADTYELVGTSMVPTTHRAVEGVARGVIDSMKQLLEAHAILPEEVVLIAHSTTQATNALLEGDVAAVGIIGLGKGVEGWWARRQTRIEHLELAPGKFLKTAHRFIDTTKDLSEAIVRQTAESLLADGAQIFVVSEAFGVDHPDAERRVVEIIQSLGHQATAATDISQVYGLRIRTRTAVINASMTPRMLETATMTERAVRTSGIEAPLMIMRSDGGIMSIEEMRRRPILTMLSGPAAGVAAALMFVKISDGIFLEVGGTSTDISVIKNGRPTIRSAEVGGHRLFVRTLDVRTVGIGGGSIPRVRGRRIVDVGPRSAHIADLAYPSFASPEKLTSPRLQTVKPLDGDPSDYLAIAVGGESKPTVTFTTTEAANTLGLVRRYGRASTAAAERIALWLAEELHSSPSEVCRVILDTAARKVVSVVRDFITEYRLDPHDIALVGGGGGAEAIVPHVGALMKLDHWIADHAEVISAIGVALGMIQDTVERSIIDPTDADLLRVRNEAFQSVLRMGAAAETVDVRVEVDPRRKRVMATARGTPDLRTRTFGGQPLPLSELGAIAARTCGVPVAQIRCVGETEFLKVFQTLTMNRKLFGLFRSSTNPTRIVDTEGIVRLKLSDAQVYGGRIGELLSRLGQLVDEFTMFGDAGGLQPDVFVALSGRIIDLSGLTSKDQVVSLLRTEAEGFGADEAAVAILSRK